MRLEADDAGVDWERLSQVYARAPLPVAQDAQRLRRAYANSDVACFAHDGDLRIGAAAAVVCDLVVDPDDQGRGVGRALMEVALARLGARKLGFLRHRSALARYPKPEGYLETGIHEDPGGP